MVRKRSFILASVSVLVLAVHPVLAQGVPDLLLTSDRVLYRPGQKIHLRALVLDRTTRRAMPRQRVSFTVRSPAGLLLSERALTNRFGVAAASLPLVKEAPVGAYRVTASSGSCVVRKDLRVKEYDLPRHEIQVKPSGKYLAPGGGLGFSLRVRYQHGPPVAGGTVEVTATTLVGTEGRDFARIRLGLDTRGQGTFRVTAPASLSKLQVLPNSATLSLKVAVTDPAGHREEVVRALPISKKPLLLGAHWLHPPLAGVENRLALTAQHPDGTPADVELTVGPGSGRKVKARTGGDGIALVDLYLDQPEPIIVSAPCGKDRCRRTVSPYDMEGRTGDQVAAYLRDLAVDRLGLVVKRPVVRSGEPIKVALRTGTTGGTVTLLMIREGRLLNKQTVRVNARRVQVTLPPVRGVRGLVTLVATRGRKLTRTLVLVLGENSLSVTLEAKPRRSRPGGEVALTITARDGQGKPVAAAVELSVLDRGIYSMGGQGLHGREPLFAQLPGPMLGLLSSTSFRWPAGGTDTSRDSQFQQAMSYFLAFTHTSDDFWNHLPTPQGATPAVTPPPWLASLAALLRRLPGTPGSPFSHALVRYAGLALGLLLALLLLLRRRRARGPRGVLLTALYVLALLALPIVPWSSAPRLEPLTSALRFETVATERPGATGVPDRDRARLVQALARPRRFEGLHPLAVDQTLADLPHDRFPPMVGPLIEITPEHIAVNGRLVVPLKDSVVHPIYKRDGASGYLIIPLLTTLQKVTSVLKAQEKAQRRNFNGMATYVIHPKASYRLVSEVLYTSGQAEYGTYGMMTPEMLRIVTPRARARVRGLVVLGVLLAAALVLLFVHRCRAPVYLAVLGLACYCGLHYLLQAYPFDDRAALRFPLEEGLRALHPWVAAGVGLAMGWEALVARRSPPAALGALALVVGLLAVPLSRDHGMYYDTSDLLTINSPRYGSAGAALIASGSPASPAGNDQGTSSGAALVRRYFPDTLHYDPLLITDGQGKATRRLRLGHQLTTWKATALASTLTGAMALARDQVIASQELQVEVEMPPRVTVGDVIHLPVSVYNHGGKEARVQVKLIPAPWFKTLAPRREVLRLAAGSGGLVYLPLKVITPGDHRLQARATSTDVADTVERPVQAVPAGAISVVQSAAAWREGTVSTRATVHLPSGAVPGSAQLDVTVLPDLVAQVSAGVEDLLQMPHGCAEQTISSTLPNVMLLTSFPRLAAERPPVARKARENAVKGYQRLLRYERPGGGFSLWGKGKADAFLSAFALELLVPLQQKLGIGGDRIANTVKAALPALNPGQGLNRQAAVTRSLARASRLTRIPGVGEAVKKAMSRLVPAARRSRDPYLIALVAGSLQDLAEDPKAVKALATRLVRLGQRTRQGGTSWSSRHTVAGSVSLGAAIETTALVSTVLLRAGLRKEARQGLFWLALNRGERGAGRASQDTLRVLTLLAELARRQRKGGRASSLPTPALNGQPLDLTGARKSTGGALLLQANTRARTGDNTLELTAGEGSQAGVTVLRLAYHLPWARAVARVGGDRLALLVTHDRTEVRLRERINARFKVSNKGLGVSMPMLRFQVPPGFQVDRSHLAALVKKRAVNRYQLEGADVVLYLPYLEANKQLELRVPLLARAPVEAAAPGAMVYSYYDPANRHIVRSVRLKVLRDPPRGAHEGKGATAVVTRLPGTPFKLNREAPGRRWRDPLRFAMERVFVKRWYVDWPASLQYRDIMARPCGAACANSRGAARRARLAAAVSKMGILKLLGHMGRGSGATADLIGSGDPGADMDRAFQGVGGVTVARGRGLSAQGPGGTTYRQLPARIRPGISANEFLTVFRARAPKDVRSTWTLKETIHGVQGTWRFGFYKGKLRRAKWSATASRATAEVIKQYKDAHRLVAEEYTRRYGKPANRSADATRPRRYARTHSVRWQTKSASFSVRLWSKGTRKRPRCLLRIDLYGP